MTPRNKRLIYLTGFMGSGKTTIAPILANTIGYTHIDIDEEIENITGKKIADIFTNLGEMFFRDIERKLLTAASKSAECVVSLGGGTIANDENISIVKSTGLLVYLKADIDEIVKRLRHKTNRPMIISTDGTILPEELLRERVRTMLTQREPYYNQADIVVITGNRRVGLTIDDIVRRITRFSF
jgi:shikimate kinase